MESWKDIGGYEGLYKISNSGKVISAIRESDRTAASFRKDFDRIGDRGPIMVPDPFVEETLPELRGKIEKALIKAPSDPAELRTLLTNENGELRLHINDNQIITLKECFITKWEIVQGHDFWDPQVTLTISVGSVTTSNMLPPEIKEEMEQSLTDIRKLLL